MSSTMKLETTAMKEQVKTQGYPNQGPNIFMPNVNHAQAGISSLQAAGPAEQDAD